VSSRISPLIRDKFVEVFGEGRISGFRVDSDLCLPDIFDAHVHVAAIHGGVDLVITADRDFTE